MNNSSEKEPLTGSRDLSFLGFPFAILSGAFLLFLIQPMIARFILPWFGGSPAVWTTCMLFFQVLLFGGYLYGDAAKRFLSARGQAVIHSCLVLAAMAILPISASDRWKPAGSTPPTSQIFLLLLTSVGLPYFVLAGTSPLVQSWFSLRYPKKSPYRLYALSNIGSLVALLGYPFLIEPNLDIRRQSWLWSIGFVIYALACGVCLKALWNQQNQRHESIVEPAETETREVARPSLRQHLLWIFLPATASVLLLATTNHVCQNIAVVPFLWIAPLTLYLLTFIIAFEHPPWYVRPAWSLAAALTILVVMLYELDVLSFGLRITDIKQLPFYLAAMFLGCMVCHGELVRSRPNARYLTGFYLWMSAGGALGGIFVSLIAPRIFNSYLEWQIGCLTAFVISVAVIMISISGQTRNVWLLRLSILIPAVAGFYTIVSETKPNPDAISRARNFYGLTSVLEFDRDNPATHRRQLRNGSTRHGMQFMDPARSQIKTDYYTEKTGIGRTILQLQERGPIRVGIIGLGVGTLAAYAEPSDAFRFYDINPEVIRMANQYFTFLRDCKGQVETVLGDARLSLEHEPPQEFDLIVLDAFSSDSIPTHLLTREAFQIYAKHLKPGGVIATHITNTYLDLAPVLRGQAEALQFGLRQLIVSRNKEENRLFTNWVVISANQDFLNRLAEESDEEPDHAAPVPLWTDSHSNLFAILKWK